MTIHVSDILTKIAASNERVTPVDVVMGEHWAEINLGNSTRLSLLRHMLRKQEGGGGSAGDACKARMRVPLQVVRRAPQAMVKVIRNGGTTTARGMRDQMSYLEKGGDAQLERSERYFGVEIDEDEKDALIEAWGLAGETTTRSDKTTHFVVSFPRDTDHGAAYRAGRAWAGEMFASGTHGDVYDYYTAFHTDRAHPHIHVIVNRRGLENGDWLKVSRRSQFNYDELRAVQVEVAAREGIVLEASPRLARGVTDRPIPDAEIRKAQKEARAARPPAHTPVTAIRAAATLVLHARQMTADAGLLEEKYPELAMAIKAIGLAIEEGREIAASPSFQTPALTIKEARERSEFIMSRRSEILDGIKQIDAGIGSIPVGPNRISIERDASRMKAEAADLMPDEADLQPHADQLADRRYQGLEVHDETEKAIKARADGAVGKLAESIGIDPATFVSRHEAPEPVSRALSDQWRRDELEDIQKNFAGREATPVDQYGQLAQAAYDDLHRNVLQTYRTAERELEAHAAKKRELHRIAKTIRESHSLDQDTEGSFRQKVMGTLHTNELRQLETGDLEAFAHVTGSIDEQRALSRRYLEIEVQRAEEKDDGARKLQLSTALARIDRDTDLADQGAVKEIAKAARRTRGLDR